MKKKNFVAQGDMNAAASQTKRVRNARKASQAKVHSPYIALRCLAAHFGLPLQGLSFAIAETPDGEDGIDLTPAVLIANSPDYIDLAHGTMQVKQLNAFGGIRTFVPACVKYDNGEFVFKAHRLNAEARISEDKLKDYFGDTVVAK